MGREKGKGARRGVQGASSSKAASRLGGPGTDGKTFVGFGGFSGSVAFGQNSAAPFTPGNNSGESTASRGYGEKVGKQKGDGLHGGVADFRLDGEVAAIFKGFKKREPVTKVKALQAFRAYIGGEGEHQSSMEAVLGAWSYYYQRLIIDNSRQVRLEAAGGHLEVLRKVGKKDLQANLPRFLAQWLRSQFDENREVARSVKESITKVLPEAILAKAVKHYLVTVLEKLCKDLAIPESAFGDSALESKEDIRDRHARVLVTSLYCVISCIESIKAHDEEWALSEGELSILKGMIKESNFGKLLLGSSSARVREASYYFVGRIALHSKKILGSCAADLSKHVVGCFKEKDPQCYKSIFEMMIVVNKEVGTMWDDVDPKVVFWPKLHQFLRTGCRDSGDFSYLALLPLLSTIPANAWEKSLGGQEGPFDLLLQTIDQLLLGITNYFGKSDRLVEVGGQCAAECLLYVSMNLAGSFAREGVHDSVESMERSFWETCMRDTFIPFVFKNSSVSEHSQLTRLGQVVYSKLCTSLAARSGSSEKSKRFLSYLTGSMETYALREFSEASSGDLESVAFLSDLEPRKEIADSVICPLAAAFLRDVEQGGKKSLSYLTSLMDVYGEHLSDQCEDFRVKLTAFCGRVSSGHGASPGICRLFMSWLKRDGGLREKWPSILSELRATEPLQVVGARLLSYMQPMEGMSCRELDDLVASLAAADFAKSHQELALKAYKAVLLSVSDTFMPVSDETAVQVLQALEMMLSGAARGVQTKNSKDLFSLIHGVLNRSKVFPKRLMNHLTALVSSAICVQEADAFSNVAAEGGKEGSFAGHTFEPSSLSSLDGLQMFSTFRTFITDWVPREGELPPEDFQAAFGKEVCKIIDCFEDGITVDLLNTLIEPHHSWPVCTDPKTGRLKGDATGSRNGYAAFLLSLLTSLERYDSVSRVSRENLWVPIEFITECTRNHGQGGVSEADVFKYICILQENDQEGGSILDDMFGKLKEGLFVDLESEDFSRVTVGSNSTFRCMSLLLHFLSDLCPAQLPALLEKHVIKASTKSSSSSELACLNLVVLLKIEQEILQNTKGCGGGGGLLDSSLQEVTDSLAPCTHLARSGVSLNDLLVGEAHASVLLAQIVSNVLVSGSLVGGQEAGNLGNQILGQHFCPALEPMITAVSSESAPEDGMQHRGKMLVYGLVKVQMQALWASASAGLPPPSAVSTDVVFQNLRMSLTRLAALLEEAAESGLNERGHAEFQMALDASEAALSVFALLLDQQAKNAKVLSIDREERAGLLGSCLRVVFAIAIMQVHQEAGIPILPALSRRRCFFKPLLGVMRHTPRSSLLEALEAANSWSAFAGKDGVKVLLAAYLSFDVQCRLRHCVGYLLSTRTYLPLIASPQEEDINNLYSEGGAVDMVSYALGNLGMLPSLAAVVFHPESASSSIEARIRCWAIFTSYLRTLGRDSLKFMCSLLRHTDVINALLSDLVGYLPTPGKSAKRGKAERVESGGGQQTLTLRDVVMNVKLLDEEDYVTQGAAAIYRSLLHLMPSSVCSWFTELKNRQLISNIESYTSVKETPQLIELELESITSRGDLEVVALQNKREVVTRYRKDDSTLELIIKLPGSFPLRPVEVEYTSKFGFGEAVLRKWLLSMRAFLRNQDGTIDDAIYLWYQNVEKQFEGVEECPICYSIIQTTDHTLPKLRCRTCNNKFHSSCMYKWFSQGKATCPMCRTLW
ncbi:E3 ubiquitin-protein ligase listerin [Chloropicon primus]|uniref:E3 ubiquitin-protein ligase listerin n=2 Tax=Chloropicon primus TaxID=1764295 RepID=A0A5B8MT70_9CHLO|nr:E3 ubiquitin-protein ligase listerin [Chloropicon primus]|eukprot:QDZ22620.1 E3 ubiquitin-protein ligase listerin [Chloropicon primus]